MTARCASPTRHAGAPLGPLCRPILHLVTAELASFAQLNIPLLACVRPGWEVDSEWLVKRLKQHRLLGSNLQYLVEWDGLDHHEQPWPDTWEFEANIGSFHRNAYTRRLTSIESKMVSVDLQPVMYSTRKSVAHAVAIAKTQCRPRIHFLEIDMLNLQAHQRRLRQGPAADRRPTARSRRPC